MEAIERSVVIINCNGCPAKFNDIPPFKDHLRKTLCDGNGTVRVLVDDPPPPEKEEKAEAENIVIVAKCRHCGKSFGRKRYLKQHEIYCPQNPSKKTLELEPEMNGNGIMVIKCPTCEKEFSTAGKHLGGAKWHVMMCGKNSASGDDRDDDVMYECGKCEKKFAMRGSGIRHENTCGKAAEKAETEMKCQFCRKKMKSLMKAGKHYFLCKKGQRKMGLKIPQEFLLKEDCAFCGKNFETKTRFINHYFLCKSRFNSGVTCEKCGFQFTNQKRFFAHIAICGKERISDAKNPHLTPADLKNRSCGKCGKKYQRIKCLESHAETCNVTKDPPPPVNKRFSAFTRATLGFGNGIREPGTGIGGVKTEFRGQRISIEEAVKMEELFQQTPNQHRRPKAQRGENPLRKCKLCPETFDDLKSWHIHAKIVHVKGNNFVCPKCNIFTGKSINDILSHMKKMHINNNNNNNNNESAVNVAAAEAEVDPLA